MVTPSIILFALAAAVGLYLISHILRGRSAPRAAAIIHGLLAATALVLLIVYALNNPGDIYTAAIVLFVTAATGGFVLFGRDLSGKPGPKWLALIHALVTIGGFGTLLYAVYG